MGSNRKAARSRGNIMTRLDELEAEIERLKTARRLPNSSYASGGPRTRGGRFLAEDLSGDRVFEVTTEPPDIFMRPELISAVSAQVFAERIVFQNTNSLGEFPSGYTTGTWVDLDPVGPLPDPNISLGFTVTGGQAVVIFGTGARLETPVDGLEMSFEVSGATSIAPGGGPTTAKFSSGDAALGVAAWESGISKISVLDLNNGTHTIASKFNSDVDDTAQAAAAFILVIAL